MSTLLSTDRTTIAFEVAGSGAALLLVHGALTDRRCWDRVVPILGRSFRVYILDRRGRGESGDTPPYSPQREIEDIIAVARSIGGPLHLLGHSSGAVGALIAAGQLGTRLDRLVLYEPPVVPGRANHDGEFVTRLSAALANGDRDAAVRIFLRDGRGLSADRIGQLRDSPGWSAMLDLSHTLLYDALLVSQRDLYDHSLGTIGNPVAVLVGTNSGQDMLDAAEASARAMRRACLISLQGQGHNAFRTDPALFAATVENVLLGPAW
jgi:pimeloyl-ACP methyl ester carboxylesterase